MMSMFSSSRTSSEKMRTGSFESTSSWPENIRNNASILTKSEREMVKMLLEMGQQHLFAMWDPPGVNNDLKHSFFRQLDELNDSYIGGIGTYVRRAKVLLAGAKAGSNPFEGYRPEIPSGITIDPFTSEYRHYEDMGIKHVGRCGFVLVAGGLGERLGYNGIKIELPSETLTGSCYLELYCQQILYMQKRYSPAGNLLPLAIMVSDDTAVKTQALLDANSYFGLEPRQVTLMKQGKVPALLSNSAHLALSSPYCVDAKPHGHGDVHALMHSTGTAYRWESEFGVEWVVFFQDTNGLAFFSLPAMLGVSEELDLQVNSLAVKRVAKQAVGAIARLVSDSGDGREMTINVEYNQLDPLLRATVSPQGDVNDPITGFSPYPGNINQLLFKMNSYVAVLKKTQGQMPEFVNPKYSDESKTLFKKPTRLECMMQDYPKLLQKEAKVGFTTVPAWLCYSPCKNNSKDAAASIAGGVPAASPFTAESDQYFVFAEMLRRLECSVEAAEPLTIQGITASPSPRIVIHPSCAIFPLEVASRFPKPSEVLISSRSSLILKGNVTVNHLVLDGSLLVEAADGTSIAVHAGKRNNVAVTNDGYSLELLTASSSSPSTVAEKDVMRGYVLKRLSEKAVSTASTTSENQKQSTSSSESSYVFNGVTLIDSAAYEGDQETSADCCSSCW